jgi:predicted RNA-binding Zn-ribbon protein involved in translation (DUF1610 family)
MIKQCPRCYEVGNCEHHGMMNGRSFTCSNCGFWGGHTKWTMPEVIQ